MRGRFDYVLSITNTVAGGLGSQGSNSTKDEGSGPEEKFDLAQARGILQRTIRHFSYVLENIPSAYSRSRENIDKVRIELLDIDASDDSELYFEKAVRNLHMCLDADAARSTSASSEAQEEHARPISLDHPEVASFIAKLHTARATESLIYLSLVNQKKGLEDLMEFMKTQEAWAKPTGNMLGDINRRLKGKVDKAELLSALEEVATLAKEWDSMIEGFLE